MKIHFISIGGSVMHQLAIALKRKGYEITGSDDEIFEPAKSNLEAEDILPQAVGWFPERIHPSLDAVILGMHAREDNPELIKAKELGINIYSFPEYIFKESGNKTRVAIGGSHGKTTTTSMIMHVLKQVGKKFDYLVGAKLEGFDQSVDITDAPLIICEADEYPASIIEKRPKFHFLFPHIAVITGIAWDHINVFPTFENYLVQFEIFIQKIEKGGHLIYNESDEVLNRLVQEHERADIYYRPYTIPQHSITIGKTTLTIEGNQQELKIFGNHNLLNLNAAWLVCKQSDIATKDFLLAISTFTGAAKRLELLAKNDNTIVYRDFAHAPSKAKATIEAAKQQFPGKKLIAVFELHTYSSLNAAFIKEYEGVMEKVDEGSVFYSKHALELKRMPELDNSVIERGFQKNGLKIFNKRKDLEEWLGSIDYKNSVLLFMSSGNYEGLNTEDFAKKITG